MTVFSYSGRVKSLEWRQQRRRTDLRDFEIFRHRPIIIYTRLPAGGTYYPICTFPASSECLIGISDTFSTFLFTGIRHLAHVLTVPQQKHTYSALHPQAWTNLQVYARKHLLSAVRWISEYRLLRSISSRSGGCMLTLCMLYADFMQRFGLNCHTLHCCIYIYNSDNG